MKNLNGSRVLLTPSGKKIASSKHIQFVDKENKKLILWEGCNNLGFKRELIFWLLFNSFFIFITYLVHKYFSIFFFRIKNHKNKHK